MVLDLPARAARALVVIGHGAGGDIDAPDLVVFRDEAFRAGVAVARVRQPYRVAGRRAPAPARQLDQAWIFVVSAMRDPAARDSADPFADAARRLRGKPVVCAGRSSGARVACRTASECGAAGVLALAFPLHPPGRPERSRALELRVDVPLLVLQGSRDAFGRRDEFPAGVEVFEVDGSGHGLTSPAFAGAAAYAVSWILDLAAAG